MSATMRQEIFGQPSLMAELLPVLRLSTAECARPSGRVFVGGCGDGFFAAGAAAGFFAEAGLDYRPASALELAFHTRFGQEDTVILASVSGGTLRTIQAAHRARKAGARTLAITCDAGSRLAAACDDRLVLPYQPLSRRTPHTADYLATLLGLATLAEAYGGERDDGLDALPEALDRCLADAAGPASDVAGALDPAARIFALGQGGNVATAQYIAAKFHESGGLAALWNETENFVHGMNFMVEPDDFVVVIGGDGPGAFRAREILPGLGQLCGHVVAIGGGFESERASVRSIDLPQLRSSLTVFPAALVGQLLCLGVVEARGLPVEEPRAGRPGAEIHAAIQRTWMTQTDETA